LSAPLIFFEAHDEVGTIPIHSVKNAPEESFSNSIGREKLGGGVLRLRRRNSFLSAEIPKPNARPQILKCLPKRDPAP
jgi:hypothetical protein